MGTVVSVRLPLATDAAALPLIDRLGVIFTNYDRRFSLYRPESELSAVANGTLTLPQASVELRDAYAEALLWRQHTDGAFTPHRPDGTIDLNGLIKATAMQQSGDALTAAGITDWCLNVGGDVSVSGSQQLGSAWTIGIVDPADRTTLLCSIVQLGTRTAVATSGSAERGDHIWRSPGQTDRPFAQVTVIANNIVTADVLATAIVAGGAAMLERTTDRWPVDVLTVASDGTLCATPGFRAALRRAKEEGNV